MNGLYVAISRVTIEGEMVVAPGLRLEPTYAHVFAHPMLAVKPPREPAAHHPAPWTAVKQSGNVETATVQLTLEPEGEVLPDDAFSRVRSTISLLRLISGLPIRAPVWADISFAEISSGKAHGGVRPFDPPLQWPMDDYPLTQDVTSTLATLLPRLQECRQEDNFAAAYALLDSMWWIPTLSAQMIAIWSSVETLMQPSRKSMTKELARLTRAALGKDRSDGDHIFNEVIRLCEARGTAVHAGHEPAADDVRASYRIARNLIIRSLSGGRG